MTEVLRRTLAAAPVVLLFAGCAGTPEAEPARLPEPLTLLHVGDTHSRLEPTEVRLTVGEGFEGGAVTAQLGGFPQLMSAVSALRNENTLFLHAGDLFQGSLYFTRYRGVADTDFWNLMRLDAATLGNHEFDRGPALLQSSLLALARFPVVSANVDARAEPSVNASLIRPFTVAQVGGERVGIVGLTTGETPFISSPGASIRFADAAASVQAGVDALSRSGVRRIVLLSHQGYAEDLKLAARVSGLDVIVGGHSHTLLGDFDRITLASRGPYPTEGRGADGGRTLVAHAYEWGKVLGVLRVWFNTAGAVTSLEAKPRAVVGRRLFRLYDVPTLSGERTRIEITRQSRLDPDEGRTTVAAWDGNAYAPVTAPEQAAAFRAVADAALARLAAEPSVFLAEADPLAVAKLTEYAAGVAQMKSDVVAHATTDLLRGLNRGPGPIVADSMSWRTGAQIALCNTGGVRTNLREGPITVATVLELLPFSNTLVTLPLTGAALLATIEEGVDYQVSRYGADPRAAYVYVSGLAFGLDLSRPRGERVRDARVKRPDGSYAPIDPEAEYSVAVNSFMAAGGDRYDTLKAAGGKYDTGFDDAETFLEYIRGRSLTDAREQRVTVVR